MNLSVRETRYLKKLLTHREWVTKFWADEKLKQENKLAASILNKINVEAVLKNWDKK